MHTLCTPALCTLRPLGLLVSPDATPQLCALPALPCSAAPLSTHPILQRTLQPWILSLASNQPQRCHPGPTSGISFLVCPGASQTRGRCTIPPPKRWLPAPLGFYSGRDPDPFPRPTWFSRSYASSCLERAGGVHVWP